MFKYLGTFNDRKKLKQRRNQDELLMTTECCYCLQHYLNLEQYAEHKQFRYIKIKVESYL
jgi:hypothetical protein